ncbi:MAG: TonB-dependent receptor [Candidatus Marinimicrobia bacterium]|nr:TonB-dependent receptor [Candidatus Neomarinimicrobiota bacterium]
MLQNLSFRIFILFIIVPFLWGGPSPNGRVLDKTTGLPISHVNVVLDDNTGSMTNTNGQFSLVTSEDEVMITFTHIGYEPVKYIGPGVNIIIEMNPRRINLPDITISATRTIEGVTPVSFSIVTPDEISLRYSTEDAPMVLSSEPGIYAYSESGNGTGYSYLSIRGFDQSRIAVMLDGVSLNDNESHQVYWVDHGDILSDASVVEIQRGIGNSLYGTAAFGGSVNVVTQITHPREQLSVSSSIGAYNTRKYRTQYFSNEMLDGKVHFTSRFTLLQSDGYRDDSQSDQQSFFGGIEYQSDKITHQFRALIGKEVSRLQWDGISRDMVDDRLKRTGKMEWTTPFTDDFLQQIYSLNSFYPIRKNLVFRNTAYLVTGSGFYEVAKSSVDFYSYNLDINDTWTDEDESAMTTDLLRRKWITNQYFGTTPMITMEMSDFRFDVGAELRKYTGHHYGEVSNFSDVTLTSIMPDWFRYYDFDGEKSSATLFAQTVWNANERTIVTGDLQYQHHDWTLIQKSIGHFNGVDIAAKWDFFNPRLGFTYKVDNLTTVFGSYGTAQKEPSDVQIFKADSVGATVKAAQPEKVFDTELGFSHKKTFHSIKLNYYHMTYQNEIISDIYDFEETEFNIVTADETIHKGIEFELVFKPVETLVLEMNGSITSATYHTGTHKQNQLPNVPQELVNLTVQYSPEPFTGISVISKYVGRQFIDSANTRSLSIDPRWTTNLGWWLTSDMWTVRIKVNNVFDTLYETYGYEYWDGYYWPGATRNATVELEYLF